MQTTRRGFLKGSVIGGTAAASACVTQPRADSAPPNTDQPSTAEQGSTVELTTTVIGACEGKYDDGPDPTPTEAD